MRITIRLLYAWRDRAASFSIVRRNGRLRTSASLDYEDTTSYSVTVTVTDGNGGTDSITVDNQRQGCQ